MSPVGALIGALVGLALATIVARLPIFRRPSIVDRVEPYLRDSSTRVAFLEDEGLITPFPTLERLLRPQLLGLGRVVDRAVGGSETTRAQIDAADLALTVEAFRLEQVAWACAAMVGMVGCLGVLTAGGSHVKPAAVVLLALVAGLGGFFARAHRLSSLVAKRQERMAAEFPTVAELLALSVSAGEGAIGALERVARIGRGEFSREIARMLASTRAGTPFVEALNELGRRSTDPAVGRFVDGVVIAVERGTPLADVLRAQAADAREAARRELLETAGRREIAMMVPVVFLVLPVTVLFALFPGFYGLSLVAP
jgi:tight adherence protein C